VQGPCELPVAQVSVEVRLHISPPCAKTPTMVFFGWDEPLDVARTFDMLQHVG
jgi:hypothetical protein